MEMVLRDRPTVKIEKKNMGFTSPPDPLSPRWERGGREKQVNAPLSRVPIVVSAYNLQKLGVRGLMHVEGSRPSPPAPLSHKGRGGGY